MNIAGTHLNHLDHIDTLQNIEVTRFAQIVWNIYKAINARTDMNIKWYMPDFCLAEIGDYCHKQPYISNLLGRPTYYFLYFWVIFYNN